MSEPIVYEFAFGEEEYRAYVTLRDRGLMRVAGLSTGLLLSPALLLAPSALSAGDARAALAFAALAVLSAGCLAAGVAGRAPWIASARRPQARAYLERHGAPRGGGPFGRRVVLGEDGVGLACWPPDEDAESALVVDVPWSEWRAARSGREGLLLECRRGRGGGLKMLLGYNMLLQAASRDGLRDAFVPASALGGADARELARWAQGRIDAAR